MTPPASITLDRIAPALAHTGVPERVLQELVAAGDDGVRTGQGFYDWRGCDPAAVRADAVERLRTLLAFLQSGVGDPPPGLRPRERNPET